MRQIPLEQVKKDNSNIRRYSDRLWRELRKVRFKPANPDGLTNQMAAEAAADQTQPNLEFRIDIMQFIRTKLSPQEGAVLQLFLFGGDLTQTQIAEKLGICQSRVAQLLGTALHVVKEEYYGVQ